MMSQATRQTTIMVWAACMATAVSCVEPPVIEPTRSAREGEGEGEGPVDLDLDLGIDDPVALEAALREVGVAGVRAVFAEDASTLAFELFFEQPLDHDAPDGRTFLQRAVLVHRHTRAPMVLNPTGYMLFEGYEQLPEELTTMLAGNQLQVEHRFFGTSMPDDVGPADWAHLTVAQAAADHHRIVTLLKRLYGDAWLETGHSKGGMTSVFHHVLYPDDVDAVVAYVAPISFAINDTRGQAFLDEVGDAACRDTIRAYQENAARQRQEIVAIMQQASPTLSVAQLEGWYAATIAPIEWGYWQFANGCADAGFYIPNPDPAGTAAELGLNFNLENQFIDLPTSFVAYSHQVQHELGQPDQYSAHLDGLLGDIENAPFTAYLDATLPFPLPTYDGGDTMREVQRRVLQHDDIVFVYGGHDPWTAVAFDPGAAGNVSVVAPGINHGALLLDLSPADRDAALDVVLGRTGIDVAGDTFAMSHIEEARWRAWREVARAHYAGRAGLRP